MSSFKLGALCLIAFALSSCGASEQPAATGGSTSTATSSTNGGGESANKLPADFPVPIYPDAKIGSVDKGTDQYTGGATTSVLYNAINDVKVVRQWYEAELPKAGWTIRPNANEQSDGSVTLVADKDALSTTIGMYPKYYPNGDARYSVIVEPKK